MFLTLLLASTAVSAVICVIVAALFDKPLHRIFERIIADEISGAWVRFIKFGIYVVGISGGVRLWELDRYISPREEGGVVELTNALWSWELFRSFVGALQAITWMLLLVFLFALIAFVVVRGMELRRGAPAG
jgi:hypothetical protein